MKPAGRFSIYRLWSWKVLGVAFVLASLSLFQNCGPAFQTNEMGQIVMSSFEGPIEVQRVSPSVLRADYPKTARAQEKAVTKTCTETSKCSTSLYLCTSGSNCGGGKYLSR